MGRRPPIRVTLTLDPGAEPVTGTIALGDETERPFVGWIELVHLVNAARGSADEADQVSDPPR